MSAQAMTADIDIESLVEEFAAQAHALEQFVDFAPYSLIRGRFNLWVEGNAALQEGHSVLAAVTKKAPGLIDQLKEREGEAQDAFLEAQLAPLMMDLSLYQHSETWAVKSFVDVTGRLARGLIESGTPDAYIQRFP